MPMVSKIAKSSSVVNSRFSSVTVCGLPPTLAAKVNLPIFIRFAQNVSVTARIKDFLRGLYKSKRIAFDV